jgi:predicted ATPase
MLVCHCPRTTILATGRELLQIAGECIFRVPPLEVPPVDYQAADHLLGHAAVALFVSRSQRLGVDVSDSDLRGVAAICRRLDGITLVIEFAASAAAAPGFRQVANGLGDRFALLTGGRRTAAALHRTLRATQDWSYELLPNPPAGGVPCGFHPGCPVAVMGDSGVDRSAVTDGVANLVAKSLVALDKAEPPSRWRLPETIRAHALEKLAQHSETQSAARTQAAHFRGLFAPLSGFRSRLIKEDVARHGREIDNVRAVLDWCFAAGGDTGIGTDLATSYAR